VIRAINTPGLAANSTILDIRADSDYLIDLVSMEWNAGLPARFEVVVGAGPDAMGSPVSLGIKESPDGSPVSWNYRFTVNRDEIIRGIAHFTEAQGVVALRLHVAGKR